MKDRNKTKAMSTENDIQEMVGCWASVPPNDYFIVKIEEGAPAVHVPLAHPHSEEVVVSDVIWDGALLHFKTCSLKNGIEVKYTFSSHSIGSIAAYYTTQYGERYMPLKRSEIKSRPEQAVTPEQVQELTAQLVAAPHKTEDVEWLLAAGADPLGACDLDDPDSWPLMSTADDAALLLLWPSLQALVSRQDKPPAKGELVWLETPWECDLGEVDGTLLIGITDGYWGEATADLYRLVNPEVLNGEYRIYYEYCRDGNGLMDIDGRPRICAYAREPRKRQGHALDREVARWSAEKGLIAKAAANFNFRFQEVKHSKDGPFRRFAWVD